MRPSITTSLGRVSLALVLLAAPLAYGADNDDGNEPPPAPAPLPPAETPPAPNPPLPPGHPGSPQAF